MTAEQVEQWKRERDIAYQTKNEDAIKAVQQHRVEMLMDCQMKTATRVKDLIKKQTDIVESINQLKEGFKERDEKLDEIARQSEEMDRKILDRFESFDKFVQGQKLKEAEIKGGLKAANWIVYLVYGLLTSGLGCALMKIWQLAQQTPAN